MFVTMIVILLKLQPLGKIARLTCKHSVKEMFGKIKRPKGSTTITKGVIIVTRKNLGKA